MPPTTYESFYLWELSYKTAQRRRPDPPAPWVLLAVGLMLGIVLDARYPIQTLVVVISFLTAGGVAIFWGRRGVVSAVAVLICATAAGAYLYDVNYRFLPADHIAHFVRDEPYLTTLEGQVVATPQRSKSAHPYFGKGGPTRSTWVLSVEKGYGPREATVLSGLVRVTVSEATYDVREGDRVRVFGELHGTTLPENPGQWNASESRRYQGVYAELHALYPEAVEKLSPAPGGWSHQFLGRVRQEARTLLLHRTYVNHPAERSLLAALILGQRTELDTKLMEIFRLTGTAHYLALSGANVGMVAMFIWMVGRILKWTRRMTGVVVLVVLLVFSILVEPCSSVWRATIMAGFFCLSFILRRPVSVLNNLAMAVIVLLLWNPMQLFDAGFQLSFVVTLGLVSLVSVLDWPLRFALGSAGRSLLKNSPVPRDRESGSSSSGGVNKTLPVEPVEDHTLLGEVRSRIVPEMKFLFVRNLHSYNLVCAVCWLVVAPLVAYHFHQLYLYGWPCTLITWPLITVITVLGMIKLLLGLIWPGSAIVTGFLLEGATGVLVWLLRHLAMLPATRLDVPVPPLWWLALYYGFLVLVLMWRRPELFRGVISQRGSNSGLAGDCSGVQERGLWLTWKYPAALGAVVLLTVGAAYWPRSVTQEFRITTLSVGAGHASILEMPDGSVWLFDAGAQMDYDIGRLVVVPALQSLNIRRIDTALVSHPNFDHYSGLLSVDDHVPIRQVVMTNHFRRLAGSDGADKVFLDHLRDRGIPIAEINRDDGTWIKSFEGSSGVRLEVLWPPSDLPENTASNDTALVVRFSYSGHSVLFTGDIDRSAESQLLDSGLDLRADVLMVPHHGSVNRMTGRFVEAVGPKYIVMSSDKRRVEWSDELAEILKNQAVFNTADVGAVTILLSQQGLSLTGFQKNRSE